MVTKRAEMVGKKYERLTVEALADRRASGEAAYGLIHVLCECGRRAVVKASSVRAGAIVSCGCYRRSAKHNRSKARPKHGLAAGGKAGPEYRAIVSAVGRCHNPHNAAYDRYGGRGIAVCARWRDPDLGAKNFIADVGPRPSASHSLDRKDNDGGYWCGKCEECVALARSANCRWATRREQNSNTRATRHIEYGGERLHLSEWARRLKTSKETIHGRLARGWDESLAVSTPVGARPCRGVLASQP